MKDLSKDFSLDRMAKYLKVSVSGYHAYFSRSVCKRKRENELFKAKILEIFWKFKCLYGIEKLDEELRKIGIRLHPRRIGRLMKEAGIQGKTRKKKQIRTTNSDHPYSISPNLIERNFCAKSPNEIWVSDITYIATHHGWLYLCTILDLFSRRIVGWSMSSSLESQFVVDAFSMAVSRRNPKAGLIFHSDRGVQYASNVFRQHICKYSVVQSMSRKGDCLDNACAESFFGLLKSELKADIFWSHNEAKREIFDYIECFYNRIRSHSYLGYLSPDEFEAKYGAA